MHVACAWFSRNLSLRRPAELQYRSAEKQRPSAIELLYNFKRAISIKVSAGTLAKTLSMTDHLVAVIQEYKKHVPVKSWRITGDYRRCLENLSDFEDRFVERIHMHHGRYRHEHSGAPTICSLRAWQCLF